MKLIFVTQNMSNILKYISTALLRKYNEEDRVSNIEESFNHPYAIFRVSKRRDSYLINDMLQTLALGGPYKGTTSVETPRAYYISISLKDIKDIINNSVENSFVTKLTRIAIKDIYPLQEPESREEEFYNGTRLRYYLSYNSRYLFNILNDMRYFTKDYMNILTKYDDLSREDLNRLYRLHTWIRCPIYVSRDLYKDYNIVNDNEFISYNNSINTYMNEEEDLNDLTFRLATIGVDANVNTQAVTFTTNKKRLQFFFRELYRMVSMKGNISQKGKDDINKILPVSTEVDLLITLSVDDLVKFIEEDSDIRKKSYFRYMDAIAQCLLNNNYKMDFIFKGRI